MKIFGHPLHLMLVHFPSALFPMDLACSILSNYFFPQVLVHASVAAMTGGALFGWLAVVTGALDLARLAQNKPGSVKKALIHGGINSTVLMGYTVLSLMAIKQQPIFKQDGTALLVIKACLVICLIVGNFTGGSLVLKDKVLDKKHI